MKLITTAIAIIVILLIAIKSVAQDKYKFEIRKQWPSYACIFIAGGFDGLRDYVQYHYNGSNQFINPRQSWTNKYKNHDPAQGRKFPGSTTWLVWTTDASHMAKFGDNLFTCGAIAFKVSSYQKRKWYWYGIEMVSYWLVNRTGFAISFNTIKIK